MGENLGGRGLGCWPGSRQYDFGEYTSQQTEMYNDLSYGDSNPTGADIGAQRRGDLGAGLTRVGSYVGRIGDGIVAGAELGFTVTGVVQGGFVAAGSLAPTSASASARSAATHRQSLRSLADDYRTPSWMKSCLREGELPPGYEVDHIKPLSIGGPDTPANMRLQGTDLHRLHHRFYRPWVK
jgi:hypothetical protein